MNNMQIKDELFKNFYPLLKFNYSDTLNNNKYGLNPNYIKEDKIKNKLIDLSLEYELGGVYVEEDEDQVFEKVFVIDINGKEYSEEIMGIWDEIIDKAEVYSIENNLNDYFQMITIILR